MGESWEYGSEQRQRYWNSVGYATDLAYFGPTNGFMSPWPGKAENFMPVVTDDSIIITTDGLSSPWRVSEDDEPLDAGEQLELYIDCPELAGREPHSLMQEPRLRIVVAVAAHLVGEHWRPTFDAYDVVALRIPNRAGPDDWSDAEGHLNLLLGVPARGREEYVRFWDDERAVRMIAVTPIRPEEADWMRGAGSREQLRDLLTASPWGNRVDFRRPSLLSAEQADPDAGDAPFLRALRRAAEHVGLPWRRAVLVVRLGTPATAVAGVEIGRARVALKPEHVQAVGIIGQAEAHYRQSLAAGQPPWVVAVFGAQQPGPARSAHVRHGDPGFAAWTRPLADAELLDAGWRELGWAEPLRP